MIGKWSAVLLLLLVHGSVLAEVLSGRVIDEDAPLSGVALTLVKAQNNVVVTTTYSDADGRYLLKVGPGEYRLRVSREEYADKWVDAIGIDGRDLNLDISLTPQAFVDSAVVPRDEDDCD